jgi:Flp pilus assembly protein TadD
MTQKKQRKRSDFASSSKPISETFARACQLHQQGQLAVAEKLYREILKINPKHAQTLLFLAHICTNSHDKRDTEDIIGRAVSANPTHPVAHFNHGVRQIHSRRYPQAIVSFNQAIALMPDYAQAYCNRGIALQNLSRHEEAIASFGQAIERDPDNAIPHSNLGVSLQALGRHHEAMAAFDQALEIVPNQATVLNNLGISALATHKYEQALTVFGKALQLLPDDIEVRVNYASALMRLRRFEQSIDHFDQVLTVSPDHRMALHQRGLALLNLGQDTLAMRSLDQAIGATSLSSEVFNHRAVALQSVGRNDDALECLDQAIALEPNHAPSHSNRGHVLRDLNRYKEAQASYAQALYLGPTEPHAHFNQGMCQLLTGDFEHGWQELEWRWKTEQYRGAQQNFLKPIWLGKESLSGKTILLHAEQGMGDTIQFCRYVTEVARLGARVLLQVQPALERALQGLQGTMQILAEGDELPEFDYHCPLMSLPLAFGTQVDTIPAYPSYLSVSPERLSKWLPQLGETGKPRIGLVWAGNASFGNDARRSMPLTCFLPLLNDQLQFVSLQTELRDGDAVILERHPEILHFGDKLTDFADTAALIAELDLVICVDTAVAHLAGALGKAVWILLPFSPDWRWLVQRSDTPWYPSARLWRQSRSYDWGEVMGAVSEEISKQLLLVKAGYQNQIGWVLELSQPPGGAGAG